MAIFSPHNVLPSSRNKEALMVVSMVEISERIVS